MPVDPAATRYARQRILPGFGDDAQQKLANAHVVVIGAGGVASGVLPALAAAGIGTVSIVDDDVVDATNLHRQTLHGPADIGRPKVDSAADTLAAIAPEVVVHRHQLRFAPGSSFELLLDADVLVDASDNLATRYHANDAASIGGIPLVWGSALRFSGQLGVAWDEKGVDYRDLFPEQLGTTDGLDDSCEIVGVIPTLCPIVGGLMATEVIKLLTGIGEPLIGRVLNYDALTGSVREIAYTRDPDAPRPGSIEELTTIPEPNPTQAVTPTDLARLLAGDTTRGIHETPPILLDVRGRAEASFASIPGSVLIPLTELADRLDELDPAVPVVVYCHHGIRSARALPVLAAAGFTRVKYLDGGIDAYAALVDSTLPRY